MDIRSGPPVYAYILQLAIIYLGYKSTKKRKNINQKEKKSFLYFVQFPKYIYNIF